MICLAFGIGAGGGSGVLVPLAAVASVVLAVLLTSRERRLGGLIRVTARDGDNFRPPLI